MPLSQMKDSDRAPNPNAGPNMSLAARADVLEQGVFQNSEMAYARGVEVRPPPALRICSPWLPLLSLHSCHCPILGDMRWQCHFASCELSCYIT